VPRACAEAGLEVVAAAFHQFPAAGATGALVLAESHLAIHTWPELDAVTLDLYVCNHSQDNRAAAEAAYARWRNSSRNARARTMSNAARSAGGAGPHLTGQTMAIRLFFFLLVFANLAVLRLGPGLFRRRRRQPRTAAAGPAVAGRKLRIVRSGTPAPGEAGRTWPAA
jgi:S-adenosylmethionine decarboxylase